MKSRRMRRMAARREEEGYMRGCFAMYEYDYVAKVA